MFTDRAFRLMTTTLGIETINGKGQTVRVPAGSILQVPSDFQAERRNATMMVQWENREIALFAVDFQARCIEVARANDERFVDR